MLKEENAGFSRRYISLYLCLHVRLLISLRRYCNSFLVCMSQLNACIPNIKY